LMFIISKMTALVHARIIDLLYFSESINTTFASVTSSVSIPFSCKTIKFFMFMPLI
ncbi:hypothetical protein L9F63_006093, partial [Diploptera punctata]